MKFFHTISFKLTVIIFVALFIVMTGVSYLHIEAQSNFLERTIYLCAERASAFSKLALLHGMRENDRADVWRTIVDMGEAPGIDVIRVYDKAGMIRYSSQRPEYGRNVDIRADACTMCHGESTEFTETSSEQFVRIYDSPRGHRALGLITPIKNGTGCSDADCHAHDPEQTVLGVLDVQMSLAEIDDQVATLRGIALLSSLFTFLILGGATSVFVYYFVHKPVASLIEGTSAVSSGDLSHTIRLDRRDELGHLVKAFNGMADELSKAKNELLTWSSTLEDRVAEKTRQLNRVQAQILHMEKMASLGKLSSVIAHELNNPLAGILTYAKLIQKRLGRGDVSVEKCAVMSKEITLIADEARRCGDIVKNLLFFARGRDGELRKTDLSEIIEKSIQLVHHKIDLYEIRLEVHLPKTPLIAVCDHSQVQQAVLAVLLNAIEAMHDGGRLSVALRGEGSECCLEIRDTGIGITPEDQRRIFEPFFTTKEEGHGTGLGLSIAYGIVQSHGGSIHVDSAPGKGARFTITIPAEQREKERSAT